MMHIEKKGLHKNILTVHVDTPFTDVFKEELDGLIVSIYEGPRDIDVGSVKLKMKQFMDRQSAKNKIGRAAEFFIHVILRKENYEQQSLLKNLEEGSIKKGFDGIYSQDNGVKMWLVESKSGNVSINGAVHHKYLKIAYDDLIKKVSGDASNNPWDNAYNHIMAMERKRDYPLFKKINQLSINYTSGTYTDIKGYHIIPCSTIFIKDSDQIPNILNIPEINGLITSFGVKEVTAICISHQAYEEFLRYLE